MARIDGKLRVFLGEDPLGGVNGLDRIIGFAEFDGEGDITVTVKASRLREKLENLITFDQIIGISLNLAYKVEPTKKGSE